MNLKAFLLAAAMVLFVVAATAQAQQVAGFVESYNTVSEAGTTPQINVYAKGPLKGKLGWSVWTLTSEPYSEAYPSLTFAPTEWLEVSSGLGLETAGDSLRFGHSVWLGHGRWSLLVLQEHGRDGVDDYWYRYLGTFQVSKTITVGVNSTRFLGTYGALRREEARQGLALGNVRHRRTSGRGWGQVQFLNLAGTFSKGRIARPFLFTAVFLFCGI